MGLCDDYMTVSSLMKLYGTKIAAWSLYWLDGYQTCYFITVRLPTIL